MIIYCIVTNDLSYDQRMIRIATTLVETGYTVHLVGRKLKRSIPLSKEPFRQHRIHCIFSKGKLFYAEYNIRLFFYLLNKKMDCICAVDLDTILPCFYISRLKKIMRVYDAHELFCEMKEVKSRPAIYRTWKRIERFAVPKFLNGYTVSSSISNEFKKMYNSNYPVIKNVPLKKDLRVTEKKDKYILYQGAVNEGRCLENIIPAMKMVNARLKICGDGNFMQQARSIADKAGLSNKVEFTGYLPPEQLQQVTANATIGINLLEDIPNNRHSLTNRFFDYMHAGIPQLCSDFAAYKEINNQFEIALLTTDTSPENIAEKLSMLMEDRDLYKRLQQNCLLAKEEYNWQREKKKLETFYKNILG